MGEVKQKEKTFEEKILERLDSLEYRVSIVMNEVRNHSSVDMDSGDKTIYLKGRVDNLQDEIKLLKNRQELPIDSVSQQRELLLDFWMNLPKTHKHKGVALHYIDNYLKSNNCG